VLENASKGLASDVLVVMNYLCHPVVSNAVKLLLNSGCAIEMGDEIREMGSYHPGKMVKKPAQPFR
jgi:hypothetical protein